MIEALRYKPEYRWCDSRCCHWNFSLNNPSSPTVGLGSTPHLTEMTTRDICWGVKDAGA